MATQQDPVPITAGPLKGQLVEHDGKVLTTIREGKAYILVPPNARTAVDPKAKSKAGEHVYCTPSTAFSERMTDGWLMLDDGSHWQMVFYNPIQQFNRDLSVLAIKAFGEDACQRKRQKHEQQHEKTKAKKVRKRKREPVEESAVEGSAKLRKSPDGSPVVVRDGASHPDQPQESKSTAEHHGMDLRATGDGGLSLDEEGRKEADAPATPLDIAKPGDETLVQNVVNEGQADDGKGAQIQQPWRPRFRILDALSATGLRALRYASEIPFATTVVANDRDKNAAKSIAVNVEHNKLTSAITTTTGDALGHMYSMAFPSPHSHGPHHVSAKYDVIDLDPYGTAAPFIDAALQALDDGGLLCVTCTDSGVFASCGYSEKTFSLYGGMPIKGYHSHEGGLRLILHSIAASAARYGIVIEPLLSLSVDFYARLFVRVRKSAADVKFLAGKTMLVYSCDHGCGAWTTQFIGRHMRHKNSDTNWKYSIAQGPSVGQLCEHCGSKMHLAGPMWGGPLHNPAFIEKMLDDLENVEEEIYQTKPRIEGMLDTALDELTVNSETMDFRSTTTESKDGIREIVPKTPPEALDHHPFFFTSSALCKVIKASAPPESLVKGALRHAGYRVTRSHCKPGSIKTDAPWTVLWEIMREWVRQKSPIKEGAVKEGLPGWRILLATRKAEEDGEAGTASGTHEDTPDVATETANGIVRREKPADPKKMKVVFDENLGKDKPSKRLVRYQQNPRENWGPMAKAKGTA